MADLYLIIGFIYGMTKMLYIFLNLGRFIDIYNRYRKRGIIKVSVGFTLFGYGLLCITAWPYLIYDEYINHEH